MVAGPNGAGKTSFAREYLPAERENLVYINADQIAKRLAASGLSGSELDVAAGREMLAEVDHHAASGVEFMLETTLATRTYAVRIPRWHGLGYSISLIYLRLPSVESSIERVRRRVRAGGHSVADDVIRRRFERSLDYLERIYKPIVDDWSVWDSLEGDFRIVETSESLL